MHERYNFDLTIVKTDKNINNISKANKSYELEIDYSPTKSNINMLDVILNEMEKIKKVLSGSEILITKEENIDYQIIQEK